MFRKSMLAGATALAILGFAVSAQAVSLGDLTVESKPGEPLEALLEINDLDLTISPLLVRVAPPATYLREGVNWPSQVQDLKLARDGSNGTVRLRLYGEQALQSGSFPLLMEMNAGGTVTVRAYEVQTKDGSFVVTPSAERTTVKGEPRRLSPEPLVVPREPEAAQDNQEAKKEGKAETKSESKAESGAAALAVKTAAAPQKEVSAASAEKQGKIRRKGRYAPNVVKEYVALNGFDASQAFHVQQDMTLWSVALLYWPSYRGATLEQLVIAFRNLNRTAFKEGDPGRLEVRSVLNPPTVEEVLAIDPVAAFHEVHGADTAIPGPTQNLIDAQRLSGEAAAKVADAQDRERTAGKAPEVVAEAGQQALEEEKAEAVREEAEAAEARAEAKAAEEAAEKAAAAEAAAAEKPAESAKPAEPAADAPKVEPVKTEAPARPADAAGSGGTNNLLFWGVGALVLALLAFLGLRSRKREEDPVEEKKPVAVLIQKDVPPTSEAQLKAVSTTVDEAVKNGTTAGAMGAGAMAYAMAQKDETRNSEKALKSEGTGAPADQPWLEPDDDELPPLDEEEKGPVLGASRQAAAVLEGVSLDLDDAVAPAQTSAPAAAPAAATPAPAEQKPAEQPEPAEPETDKERALAKALDAKLKLATSFVSLGAVDEALELLQEVKRRGGDELRHRAEVLEERIKTQTDPK
ncbi:MAG: fimbrial protein FimV [Sutterella wadsworthensis]|nr:fimbrial protein FimV [Sutterella wadsworthensis]